MVHKPAPLPPREHPRIDALHRLDVLDTAPEPAFDDIVRLATFICGVPIALVSLVDRERQWFKACIGLDVRETHRDQAFCAHAILVPEDVMVVEDTTKDARFAENPLVTGAPNIRFYAGAPIVTASGHALGTVCVIDTVCRTLTTGQSNALMALARQTAALLELREMNTSVETERRKLSRKVIEALADDKATHGGLRQNQRIAAVGQLTSGIAHDFNNLLQAISATMQIVERKAHSPEDVRRWAKSGLQSVDRGASLIGQLMAFSRDTAPAATPVCVAERIGQMEELLTRVLSPEVRLAFDRTSAGREVLCDGTQLEAAVLNLVINSRDAMNNVGYIHVSTELQTVTGDRQLSDGDYVVLKVTDDGPGMSPELYCTKVFEPFFTTKQEGRGTGLGLAQVYAFAEKSGGVARIESAEGVGTVVTLFLRAVESRPAVRDVAVAAPVLAQVSMGARVLLVDDDEKVRDVLAELLADVGYRVTSVASSIAAVNALEQNVPDVVITDCAMQGLSGAGLARVLREFRPGLPMLFITGQGDVDEMRSRLDHDAVVLQKPLSVERVVADIERVLVQQRTV